jgi:secreted trypsin-like serine protease
MSIIFLFTWFFIQNSFTSISSSIYFCSLNSTCGCSLKSTVVTKIIGGIEADIDSWGWAVSIRLINSHICGGSLISPELVVTAAHCFVSVDAISKLSVTAGSTYLNDINQQRSISEIFIHRKYDSISFTNDIAVIRLSTPFNMKGSSLALICLSTKIIEFKSNDTNAIAIGWGVVSVRSQVPSNALRQVALKTIANTDITCRRSIKDIQVQFCAGVSGGGKGIRNKRL